MIRRAAFPVDFDVLGADALVHQRGGNSGKGLFDEFVEPLSRVVFVNDDLFQGGIPRFSWFCESIVAYEYEYIVTATPSIFKHIK